jgi:hypothetical protein
VTPLRASVVDTTGLRDLVKGSFSIFAVLKEKMRLRVRRSLVV